MKSGTKSCFITSGAFGDTLPYSLPYSHANMFHILTKKEGGVIMIADNPPPLDMSTFIDSRVNFYYHFNKHPEYLVNFH